MTRIVGSLYSSKRRKEYLRVSTFVPTVEHRIGLPLGKASTPFHGVSVKRKFLKVISIFGCFFLILSRASTGSLNGRMTSSCSGLEPPPMAIVEASEARREEAILDPIQLTVILKNRTVSAVSCMART